MASPSFFNRAPTLQALFTRLRCDRDRRGCSVRLKGRPQLYQQVSQVGTASGEPGWGDSPVALPKAFCPDQAKCNPSRDGLWTPLRCCRRDQDISAAAPKRAFGTLFKFLGSAGVPFLRPGLHDTRAPRGAAVKTGRRPSPEAARSGVDGCEHGARLDQVGSYSSCRVMVLTGL